MLHTYPAQKGANTAKIITSSSEISINNDGITIAKRSIYQPTNLFKRFAKTHRTFCDNTPETFTLVSLRYGSNITSEYF
jgi:hypothetical protein